MRGSAGTEGPGWRGPVARGAAAGSSLAGSPVMSRRPKAAKAAKEVVPAEKEPKEDAKLRANLSDSAALKTHPRRYGGRGKQPAVDSEYLLLCVLPSDMRAVDACQDNLGQLCAFVGSF